MKRLGISFLFIVLSAVACGDVPQRGGHDGDDTECDSGDPFLDLGKCSEESGEGATGTTSTGNMSAASSSSGGMQGAGGASSAGGLASGAGSSGSGRGGPGAGGGTGTGDDPHDPLCVAFADRNFECWNPEDDWEYLADVCDWSVERMQCVDFITCVVDAPTCIASIDCPPCR